MPYMCLQMNYGFKVPPRKDYNAEVVLLLTSLGVKRREYNTSRHCMDFLDIVRCHYKVIDFNIDTGGDEFGAGSKPDLDIVRRLYQSHRVQQNPADGLISLPQILIDGVNIGDDTCLQTLEDLDFLDGILKQTICPQCMSDRSGEYCHNCQTLFQEIMPKRQTRDDLLKRLKRQRIPLVFDSDNEDDEDDDDEEDSNAEQA